MSAIASGLITASMIASPALAQESEMRQVDSSIYVQPEIEQSYSPADTAAAIALTLVGGAAVAAGISTAKKRQRLESPVTFPSAQTNASQFSTPSVLNQANRSLRRKLLLLLHEDQQAAERLVKQASFRHPGKSPNWYLEKVIYDLQRDRGITG